MPTGSVVSRGYLAVVDGVRGRVRATFDACAVVTVDGGPALVLHAGGRRDHTPTSLCTATWPPSPSPLAVGDEVAGRAGHLRIGGLVLDARAARVWRPQPPRAASARPDGAAIVEHHRLALQAADRRTAALLPALADALARDDDDRATGCVRSLVGRGPGLTPSGDDALVGLLAVLQRLAPHALAAARLAAAVSAHAHRTGDISAHYLRLAVDGHVGEPLADLCDALAGGAPRPVRAAADRVAGAGATSGADALHGVVSGLRLVAAQRAAVAA